MSKYTIWYNPLYHHSAAPLDDVVKAAIDEHTLSNTVIETIPQDFTPGEITSTNRLYYGGLITF